MGRPTGNYSEHGMTIIEPVLGHPLKIPTLTTDEVDELYSNCKHYGRHVFEYSPALAASHPTQHARSYKYCKRVVAASGGAPERYLSYLVQRHRLRVHQLRHRQIKQFDNEAENIKMKFEELEMAYSNGTLGGSYPESNLWLIRALENAPPHMKESHFHDYVTELLELALLIDRYPETGDMYKPVIEAQLEMPFAMLMKDYTVVNFANNKATRESAAWARLLAGGEYGTLFVYARAEDDVEDEHSVPENVELESARAAQRRIADEIFRSRTPTPVAPSQRSAALAPPPGPGDGGDPAPADTLVVEPIYINQGRLSRLDIPETPYRPDSPPSYSQAVWD